MRSQLHLAAGDADRFVVLDTETTGVYPKDRVVEIALVTISLDGQVLDVFDTLVQPMRDVGAGHIHGITASMLTGAPTFDEIAGDIALRIHGACLVAHNLPFDLRMIRSEFERLGHTLAVRQGIDTLRATRARLQVACEQYDIDLTDAHSALADAHATAELFLRAVEDCGTGLAATAPTSLLRSGKVKRRQDAARVEVTESPLIVYLASRLPLSGVAAAAIEYLELVGRAVADLHVTRDEREYLQSFAVELGMTERDVAQAHRRFVNELVDAALEDGEVTEQEHDMLLRIATGLGVDIGVVESRVSPLRQSSGAVTIEAGMSVVFTGEHPSLARDNLAQIIEARGLRIQDGVTRSTSIVAASDPSSNSGKAAKARRYGVPIVDVRDLAEALPGDQIPAVGVGGSGRSVVTCPDCLTTWTTASAVWARALQRCSECLGPGQHRAADRPSSTTGSGVGSPTETLACAECGASWDRIRTRGRKPRVCPECLG